MANTSLINQTKNYFAYIGNRVKTIDDISLMYSSFRKQFNHNFSQHIQKLSVVYFLNDLTKSKDIDEIVYHAVAFLFNTIEKPYLGRDVKNHSDKIEIFLNCSKQISDFFNDCSQITNKHWVYLIDNYIKNSKNIPLNYKVKFLNIFNSEKIVNQYNCLLSIASKDKELFEFIKNNNYSFCQEDFTYAHLFGLENQIPYSQKIISSKDIDYLLLSSVVDTSSDKFQNLLEKFINSTKALCSFREKLNSKYIEKHLEPSFFEKIMITANVEKSMKKLDQYLKYIQLEEVVNIKIENKSSKANKI